MPKTNYGYTLYDKQRQRGIASANITGVVKKKKRSSIPYAQKFDIITKYDSLSSKKQIYLDSIGVDRSQVSKWRKKIQSNESLKTSMLKKDHKGGNTMSIWLILGSTKLSVLQENEIYYHIMDARRNMLVVSGKWILLKAQTISKQHLSYSWLRRFMIRHKLAFRCGTSRSYIIDNEDVLNILRLERRMRYLWDTNDYVYIINIDETAVQFNMQGKKTVDIKGSNEVLVDGNASRKRATACLGIMYNIHTNECTKLTPYIIFQGIFDEIN